MRKPATEFHLSEFFAGLAWALKYALMAGFVGLLAPGSRMTDGAIWHTDRAIAWSLTVLLVLGAARTLFLFGNRATNDQLRFEIEAEKERASSLSPIEPTYRYGRRMADEYFVSEHERVERFEVRRTRAANFAMQSLNKNVGPLRVRVGQFAYDAPEVWRTSGTGVLLVSNRRMLWLGTTRRQEWRWSTVGDVIPDSNGLLVFGRSGRPIGLKMKPDPNVFAFIEQQISNA